MGSSGDMNYTVIPLSGPSGSQAYGINANGETAGISFQPTASGVLWFRNGSETLLSSDSYLYSLNDSGDAVGVGGADNAPTEFALLFLGGVTSDLSDVIGKGSVCTDINNAGLVCGAAWYATETKNRRAFIYDTGSASVVWIDPVHGDSSGGSAINENGEVAGTSMDSTSTHGFFYSAGKAADIGTCAFISDLNNARQIVGSIGKPLPHNFSPSLWDASILPVAVKEIPVPAGFLGGHANGINSSGVVVGTCWTQATYDVNPSAFIYDGTKSFDLNGLIADSRWQLQFANGINDAGQIVGGGTYDGQPSGFLLIPQKGPSNAIGLVASLILAGVAVDGGGTVVVSGVPIPVGPWGELSPEKQQIVLGLSIDQLAEKITDSKAGQTIRGAAQELVRTSVDRMISNLEGTGKQNRASVERKQSFRMGNSVFSKQSQLLPD